MPRSKRTRFVVAGGIIVVAVIVAVAVIAAGNAAAEMSVAQAASQAGTSQRVKVTGKVVNNSYTIDGDVLTFSIADEDDESQTLRVTYDKGVSATFGNGVTAICTGEMGADGMLHCTDLVTKCPSKYETATDALSVSSALGYGEQIVDKPVKVKGVISGAISDVTEATRFSLADESDPSVTMPVSYEGAIPDGVGEGSTVLLTGSFDSSGAFSATDLAEPDSEE